MGVDCAIRWGALPDSDLIVRPLGMAKRITCASPDYLDAFGKPSTLGDLKRHKMVGRQSLTSGVVRPLQFVIDDEAQTVAPPAQVSVTGPEGYKELTRLGFGLAQMPLFHIDEDPASGRLTEVLPDVPVPDVPISLLYPRSRQLSSRVRVFIGWAVAAFRNDRYM